MPSAAEFGLASAIVKSLTQVVDTWALAQMPSLALLIGSDAFNAHFSTKWATLTNAAAWPLVLPSYPTLPMQQNRRNCVADLGGAPIAGPGQALYFRNKTDDQVNAKFIAVLSNVLKEVISAAPERPPHPAGLWSAFGIPIS